MAGIPSISKVVYTIEALGRVVQGGTCESTDASWIKIGPYSKEPGLCEVTVKTVVRQNVPGLAQNVSDPSILQIFICNFFGVYR